jgi:hypothetical protein
LPREKGDGAFDDYPGAPPNRNDGAATHTFGHLSDAGAHVRARRLERPGARARLPEGVRRLDSPRFRDGNQGAIRDGIVPGGQLSFALRARRLPRGRVSRPSPRVNPGTI